MTSRSSSARRPLATSPFNKPPVEPPPPVEYAVGDRVTHDRYGLGTVTDIADWPRSVTINFGTETRRINIPNDKLAQL